MTVQQGNGINPKWLGIIAVLFGILLVANHGNELLKQSVLTPGSAAELFVPANCRADELEEEGLSQQECELMVSNVQIALVSSPQWFRPAMLWLSALGIFFGIFSIVTGIAFVGGRKMNLTMAKFCFAALLTVDLCTFIAVVNTGPLLRAQDLWPTLLWFFIHLTIFAVVMSSSTPIEQENS